MVIKRIKGDNYNLDVQITDINDIAIDLTGSTVFFTVKRNLEDDDASAIINKTITSFASPTTGDVSIVLTSSDCDLLGTFFYDIKIKTSGGIITSVATDSIIFQNHVTIRTI